MIGNDFAGEKVLVTLEKHQSQAGQPPDDLAERFPKVFAACTATQAMYRGNKDDMDLSDSFMYKRYKRFALVPHVVSGLAFL